MTNLFSNIFATVVIAKWTGELDPVRVDAEGRCLRKRSGPVDDSFMPIEPSPCTTITGLSGHATFAPSPAPNSADAPVIRSASSGYGAFGDGNP